MLRSVDQLAVAIPDGALLAIPADYGGVAMAVSFALLRRGVRDLRLLTVPTSGLQADLLIGAGCVAEIETAGVLLGEYGLAPNFGQAVRHGAVRIVDSSCPAIHAGLQAAEKGVPFLPLRGFLGSDLIGVRPDWRVVQNPLADDDDPILLVPARRPDVALFHAPLADRHGNVWIGVRRELATLAHASARTLVTVEALHDGDLLADPQLAAGTLPHLYVEAVAVAPNGAWPLALPGHYGADAEVLRRYVRDPAALIAEWRHAA